MSARRVSLADLPSLEGRELGVSAPVAVTQERIARFAEATEDRQWIHLDADRAAGTPVGGTIAHGFLTLSLGSALLFDIVEVTDADQVVNVGLNKVRFISPVPSGADIEMAARVLAVTEVRGGYQLEFECTYRVPGAERPACVAHVLFRYLGAL